MKPKVQAIFFDMDATVVEEETLVEIAKYAGKGVEIARLTNAAMTGQMDFATALRQRVKMLAGTPESILTDVIAHLTLSSGIQEFCHLAKSHQVKLFLISGGFVQLAAAVAKKLDFDGFHANQFEILDGKLTGNLLGQIIGADEKRDFLIETCSHLNLAPSQSAAVGDGANDLKMLGVAGISVGFRPKDVLRKHVHFINDSGDHRTMIPWLFS